MAFREQSNAVTPGSVSPTVSYPMQYIKGIRIKNYRVLRDVSFGSIAAAPTSVEPGEESWQTGDALTPLTVVIGRNGYGKSTLCDALGFIVDCLKSDAEQTCLRRGGFDKIVSEPVNPTGDRRTDRRIEFEIRYGSLLYTLCIAADEYNVPYVFAETLSHTDREFSRRETLNFFARKGVGKIVKPNSETVGDIRLADRRRLVLSTLGNMSQYPDIVAFRQFLDSWYLCYFSPDAARQTPLAGPQCHLSSSGDNLANVVEYWEREHASRLDDMLQRVLGRVLGLERIETARTEDGRLLLRFRENGRQSPFYVSQMSDGTLKLIAYLLLLGDPAPPPLICFEEPENGLYHKLLGAFIDEIRRHCTPRPGETRNGAQFFITTHQPYLVDSLQPQEVWILDKGDDGYAHVRRASEDPTVRSMFAEGMPLGALWFSEYLDSV